ESGSPVSGTFTYTPAGGTVLGAGGNKTLSVTFTPTEPIHYTTAAATAQITVNPAVLTVTANNRTKTYGQTVTFAGTEFTPAGLVNGDTVTSVALTSSGAAATASASGSPYAIVPSAAIGTGLGNYTIGYVNGALTVTRAVLTIAADSKTRAYGTANPAFTANYGGFVNGETLATSGVTGAPSLTT